MRFQILSVFAVIAPIATGMTIAPRSEVLADGSEYKDGTLSNGYKWQSTGRLTHGCTNSTAHPIHITDCYELSLISDPTKELDPHDSPGRQRIEFATPNGADGTHHSYQWKYYLSSETGTTSSFFHLMQILTRGGTGGPVVTLDAVNDKIAIRDQVRGCTENHCPSIPLGNFTDRTTEHSMDVIYGTNGQMSYTVKDYDTGETLISYSAKGSMGTNATAIKCGTYRSAVKGITKSLARVGDFSGQ